MRSLFVLLLAANAAKCKKKTRDLGVRKEIDKLGLMKCAECPEGATGSSCQLCMNGFFRQNKKCVKCKCQAETSFSGCTRRGRCRCLSRFAGRRCNKCAEGFEHFPKCTPINKDQECLCHPITAWSVCPSRDHGRCHCKSTKYGGRYCNECAPGRVNFPECEFEDSPVKNSDLGRDTNGQVILKRNTRHLQRRTRQYYSSNSNPYDLNRRLTDLEKKHTELLYMWEDLQHHVEEKTRYLGQFLMDEEGMVPVYNETLHELEKMVADVDKNMCQKVSTWTYFKNETEKLQKHATDTNSALEEIEDFKELKNELEKVLENDDLLLSNETYQDLVDLYDISIARFESIHGLIMDQGHDIICRSKRIDNVEEVVKFFLNDTEVSDSEKTDYASMLPENSNCTDEADDLDLAIKAFEDDREILNGIDNYEGDVSKMTKKNIYKMDKIDRFLSQYFENDFNSLDELAGQVKCNHSQIQTQITEFSNQWLRTDKKMPPEIILPFCSNATNDCQTKYDDNIECRENSEAMKAIFEMFEEFDRMLTAYEDVAEESIQILTENGEDIKNFAQERRLDALLTDENWKKFNDSEIYKNFKTKFQRRIDNEIRKIEMLEDATFIYGNVSVYQNLCNEIAGTDDLDKCNEKISIPIRNRNRRELDYSDFEIRQEGSGEDYDDDEEIKDESEEAHGCDSMAFNEYDICSDLEAAMEDSQKLQSTNTELLKTLEELDEVYQENLGKWCPPLEKKLDGRILDGSDQDVIQECQGQNDTVYQQYENFLLELEAELERENEEELLPKRSPRDAHKSKDDEIIESIEMIEVAIPQSGDVFDQLIKDAENIIDEYAEREIKKMPQHLVAKENDKSLCPPKLKLATYLKNKDDYICPIIHFDDEIKKRIESQKTVSDSISDEIKEIDELLSEIKSFSSTAEEILKSLSRSGLPAKVVRPKDTDISKKMDLPKAVVESFKDSSIGLDVHFSMQTVPHYANLFYLGHEEDFNKDPTRRRKRRKRENKIKGDAIFVSLEGHSDTDDECPKDSEEWMLKVDIFTKEGGHRNLSATIPDKEKDGGRYVNVRLLQRLNRFELLVRSTNLAIDSQMTTDNLVQCTDQDADEDESCARDFEFFELTDNPRILFNDQEPKLIMSERPKRLRTKAKKESDCLDFDNCKEQLWCLIDQLQDLDERNTYIQENSLRKEISYLYTPTNLGGREVGFMGLKINRIEALKPSYEPKVDTTFNFIVNNKFTVPEKFTSSSKRECTRFDAGGKIVLNSIELGNHLDFFTESFDNALAATRKCITEEVCDSDESAAVVFVAEMYDVDVSKGFDIFSFASGKISISNGDIILTKKNGEQVVKALKNIDSCRGKHCDIKMGIALGGINQGTRSYKAYGRIFVNGESTNLVGSFFESLPLTKDSSQFWSDTAGISELEFYGPEGHVVKHRIVASDVFNFRREINSMIDGECDHCATLDVTPFRNCAPNILSSISNVASTCEQIPTLDLHLDESSVFYELKHDKSTWSEVFKPELDRHGLMGHTYLSYSLDGLKSRALGIRAKFTVHECSPSPTYHNILQYVVKFFDENKEFDKVYSMDSFTEMSQIIDERPETVQEYV